MAVGRGEYIHWGECKVVEEGCGARTGKPGMEGRRVKHGRCDTVLGGKSVVQGNGRTRWKR